MTRYRAATFQNRPLMRDSRRPVIRRSSYGSSLMALLSAAPSSTTSSPRSIRSTNRPSARSCRAASNAVSRSSAGDKADPLAKMTIYGTKISSLMWRPYCKDAGFHHPERQIAERDHDQYSWDSDNRRRYRGLAGSYRPQSEHRTSNMGSPDDSSKGNGDWHTSVSVQFLANRQVTLVRRSGS
jgi:hypothetical protein